ncbi:MAG TPA: DUF1080 domain-containing protein, partial [Armatimonadota bacterium]|nr:DUF1080 domain-containing protein [Armatimonadota bacterium]
MRNARRCFLFLSVCVLSTALMLHPAMAADNTLTAEEQQQGWQLLFDGKSLNGWVPAGNKESWLAQNGNISCLGKGGHLLRTAGQYGNFVLSLEFKLTANANSGVFIHWSDLNDWLNKSIEVQILDSFGKGRLSTQECGAIYDCLAPTKIACRPIGVWNKMQITCDRNSIKVVLNGETITVMDTDQWSTAGMNPDGTKNKFKYALKELPHKGYIALQDHGMPVSFRNIKILNL